MFEAYLSLIVFGTLLIGSPGPGPMAIAAVGATHGMRQGWVFLAGLVSGFLVVLVVEGFGMAALLSRWPNWRQGLQLFAMCYVLYLAHRIATNPLWKTPQTAVKPPGFWDAVIVNATNPKAYAVLMTINSQWLLPYDNDAVAYAMTGLVCLGIVFVVDVFWLVLGASLRRVFRSKQSAQRIQWTFAGLMVLAVLVVLLKSEW